MRVCPCHDCGWLKTHPPRRCWLCPRQRECPPTCVLEDWSRTSALRQLAERLAQCCSASMCVMRTRRMPQTCLRGRRSASLLPACLRSSWGRLGDRGPSRGTRIFEKIGKIRPRLQERKRVLARDARYQCGRKERRSALFEVAHAYGIETAGIARRTHCCALGL